MQDLSVFRFSWEKNELSAARQELDEIKRLVATRRRQRLREEIKCQLAALQFKRARTRYFDILRKAGFNPDQPRVPAGSSGGGQWTEDGGESSHNKVPAPHAQYAQTQINIDPSALTGISTIDDTTKKLANVLARVKDTVDYTSDLSPQRYGTKIHAAFAKAVRAQGLPGIAPSDVETTFSGNRYGAKNSVRTDVVLRNDIGDVIAIYDVKTGDKGIDPARAAYLRLKLGVGNEVPIIQMSFPYGVTRKYALFG